MEDKELIEFCEKFVRLILNNLKMTVTEDVIKDSIALSFEICSKHPEWTPRQMVYAIRRAMFFNANFMKKSNFVKKLHEFLFRQKSAYRKDDSTCRKACRVS